MEPGVLVALTTAVFVVALLYSSVGHAGATGYIPVMSLPSLAPAEIKPIARREEVPDTFEVTAWTEEGEVMGVRHKELALEGVKYHAESILTPEGPRLLEAFLKRTD